MGFEFWLGNPFYTKLGACLRNWRVSMVGYVSLQRSNVDMKVFQAPFLRRSCGEVQDLDFGTRFQNSNMFPWRSQPPSFICCNLQYFNHKRSNGWWSVQLKLPWTLTKFSPLCFICCHSYHLDCWRGCDWVKEVVKTSIHKLKVFPLAIYIIVLLLFLPKFSTSKKVMTKL